MDFVSVNSWLLIVYDTGIYAIIYVLYVHVPVSYGFRFNCFTTSQVILPAVTSAISN